MSVAETIHSLCAIRTAPSVQVRPHNCHQCVKSRRHMVKRIEVLFQKSIK